MHREIVDLSIKAHENFQDIELLKKIKEQIEIIYSIFAIRLLSQSQGQCLHKYFPHRFPCQIQPFA